DVVDVISFSMSGLLIGTVITKVKIERYVYAHKIQNIAMHDGLTGCYNRTEYNHYIENNMDFLSEDLAVIEVDINDLKSVNDTVGHEAGDEMIVAVSGALKASFDTYGKCYRTGGDEFVIIADLNETQLQKELEEVIKTLSEHNGNLVKGISVSVGYAYKKKCAEKTIRGLIDLADKKMYEDKAKYYSKPAHSRRK
ncbi:MAG: GGDEF domain-containing protein, partial [Erysipelotrichaceae bacterium]|nr:GGDEF domain-containing protein [Erysipelotrichaceae bacterium]